MNIKPYLYFDGRCEEAIEFYKTALAAKVERMMRFSQMPPNPGGGGSDCGPVNPEKIMHAELRIGDTTLMCSDGDAKGQAKFQGISLAVEAASEAEAEQMFDALSSAGGQVQMPLTKTFFSPKFGMCADKFGVSWMIMACMPK